MENFGNNTKKDIETLSSDHDQNSIITSLSSEIISSISSSIIKSSETNSSNNLVDNKLPLSNQFTTFGFLIGLLLLVLINIGPYMYYKFVKNKKIFKSAGLEPKHTI